MHEEIWNELSVMGATATLHERLIRKTGRANLSRNTIWLAFKEEASTPLRELIVSEGKKLLAELKAILDQNVVAV